LQRYFPRVFYRKRSKGEGCISTIKRKFLDHVLSRIKEIQRHEVLLLGIIYNTHLFFPGAFPQGRAFVITINVIEQVMLREHLVKVSA